MADTGLSEPSKKWKPEYAEARRRRRHENAEHRQKSREQNLAWKKRNPEHNKALKRANAHRRHLRKIEAAAGRPKADRCELCRTKEDGTRATQIMYDHCHKTGLFRGWICHRCNVALGYMRDDIKLARRIVKYLEKHATAGEADEALTLSL